MRLAQPTTVAPGVAVSAIKIDPPTCRVPVRAVSVSSRTAVATIHYPVLLASFVLAMLRVL